MSNYIPTSERDFFRDYIVYRAHDSLGDILVVDNQHYRNLTFGLIDRQSSMNVKRPHVLIDEYTRAMMLVLGFTTPHHVTVLGLGGGCLLRSLCHTLPECKIHAIELRQQVYEVASEYFGIPESNNILITIADAKYWLQNTEKSSTNIIFADMYHSDGVDSYQVQKNFIQQCARVLNNDGWLVINFHEITNFKTPFFKYLCSRFSDVFVCSTSSGNDIVLASKHPIAALHQFEFMVTALEEKLETKIMHLFKNLARL